MHGAGTKVFGKCMALSILISGHLLALQRVGGPGPRGLVPRGLVPGVAKGVSSCLDSAPKIAKPLQTIRNHTEPLQTTPPTEKVLILPKCCPQASYHPDHADSCLRQEDQESSGIVNMMRAQTIIWGCEAAQNISFPVVYWLTC